MSTDTSVDVSQIQDEELLRKMWQDTEDFGKKKEIRSHMYKLREERLRNFYSSNDTSSEHSQRVSTINESNAKEQFGPTHANSLRDHSFLSLKSKEIRDSESPTRDIQYRIPDKSDGNQGWNIISTNEKIPGGYSTSQVAVTSGTEKIDGGVANYLAECSQKASATSEGDDKNFVKSFKTNAKNSVQQVAKREDGSGNYQSISNFSNSSSKVITHHQSSSQDTVDAGSFPPNIDNTVEYKTYTTNVPAELKSNPNYVDGKTKVTTETRTLADGTTVTTTRYETKYGSTDSSTNYSTSSTNQAFVVNEERDYNSKTERKDNLDSSKVKIIRNEPSVERTKTTNVSSNKNTRQNQNVTDSHTTRSINVVVDRNEQSDFDDDRESVTSETYRNIKNNENTTRRVTTEKIVKTDDQDFIRNTESQNITSIKTHDIPRYVEPLPHNVDTRSKTDKTETNITIKKQHYPEQVDQEYVIHITPNTSKPSLVEKQDKVITTIIRTVEDYNKKQDTKVSNQVVEHINKRISEDLSPTHEAFARSLRAVSPDHDKKRGSNRSLKSSVTSLRSSQSPDKKPRDRSTPENRYTTTPSRETSPTKNTRTPFQNGTPKHVTKYVPRNRSTSPGSDVEVNRNKVNRNINKTTVNVEETLVNRTTIGNKPSRPKQNPTDGRATSPSKPHIRESPKKEKPQERQDRPFKRRDTYEERCKQILGITDSKDQTVKIETNRNVKNAVKDVKITKELSRDKLIKSTSKSPEKVFKPKDGVPKTKTLNRDDYPSQKRQIPVQESSPNDDQDKPGKVANEPEITKKYVKPLCDGDCFPHLQKKPQTCSPTRKPNKDSDDSDTEIEKNHKIVKKDNPYKEYPADAREDSRKIDVEEIDIDENVTIKHQTTVNRKSLLKEPNSKGCLPSNKKPEVDRKTETQHTTISNITSNTFGSPKHPNKNIPGEENVCTPRPTHGKRPTSQNLDDETVDTKHYNKTTTTFTRPSKPTKKSPDDDEPRPTEVIDDFYRRNINVDKKNTVTIEFEVTDDKNKPLDKPRGYPSSNKPETDHSIKTVTTEYSSTFTRPNKPDKKSPRRPENSDEDEKVPDNSFYRNTKTDETETITTEHRVLDRKSPEKKPSNKGQVSSPKTPTTTNKKPKEDVSETEYSSTFTRPNKPDKKSPSGHKKPENDGEVPDDFSCQSIKTDETRTVTTDYRVIDRKSPEKKPTNQNKEQVPSSRKSTTTNKRVIENVTETEYSNTYTRPNKPSKKFPSGQERPEDDDKVPDDSYYKNNETDETRTVSSDYYVVNRKSPEKKPTNQNKDQVPSSKKPTTTNKRVTENVTETEYSGTFTRPNKPGKKSPREQERPEEDENVSDNSYYETIETDETKVVKTDYRVINRKNPEKKPLNQTKDQNPSSRKPITTTEKVDINVPETEYSSTFTRPKKIDKKSLSKCENPDDDDDDDKDNENVPENLYFKTTKTDNTDIITKGYRVVDRQSPEKKPVYQKEDQVRSSRKPTTTNKITNKNVSETEHVTKTVTVDHSNTYTRPKNYPDVENVSKSKPSGPKKVPGDFHQDNVKTDRRGTDEKSPERKPINKTRESKSPSKKPTSTDRKVNEKISETSTTRTVTSEQSTTFTRPKNKKSPSPLGDVCKPIGKNLDTDKKTLKDHKVPTEDDTENDHGFTETTDILYSHSERSPIRKKPQPHDDEESSTSDDDDIDDDSSIRKNISVDYDEESEVTITKKESISSRTKPQQGQPKYGNLKPVKSSPGKPDQKPTTNGVRNTKHSSLYENQKRVMEVTEYTDSYCTPKKITKGKEPGALQQPTKISQKNLPDRSSPQKQVTEVRTTKNNSNVRQTTKTQTDKKTDTGDKRHVVTTTISLSPKTKPSTDKKTDKKPTPTKMEPTIPSSRVTEVNKVTVKTSSRNVTSTVPQADKKITRTVSNKTIVKPSHPVPVRGHSKPELLEKYQKNIETEKNKKNVVTTKSITLDNFYEDDNEVIIKLQRSVSSREPTPNRICPRPVSNNDDTSNERYPDEVTEPEEPFKKPTRLSDIAVIESSKLIQNERKHNKVTSLKQLQETDEVDKIYPVDKKLRVPEQPLRPKSPKCENYSDDESFTSVSDKISRFIETAENVQTYASKPVMERPDATQVSKDIVTDDCLLSVSEKVNKFTAAQHNVNVSKPKPEYQSPKRKPATDNLPRETSPREPSESELFKKYRSDTTETVSKTEFERVNYSKQESPARESPSRELPRHESPTRKYPTGDSRRRDSPLRESPRKDSPHRESPRKDSPLRESPRKDLPQHRESPQRCIPTSQKSPLHNEEFVKDKSPKRDRPYERESSKTSLKDIYQQETQTTKFSTVKSSKFLIEDSKNKKPRDQSPNTEIIIKKTTKRPEVPQETPKSIYSQNISKNDTTLTTECVQIEDEDQTYTRTTAPVKQTPDKKSPTKTITRKEIYEANYKTPDLTPKSGRVTLSSVGRLRSTESMKKAKELFENFSKTQLTETTAQKTKKPVSPNKTIKEGYDLKSTQLIMNKVKPNSRVPHYMLPLDRSPDEDEVVCSETENLHPKAAHPNITSSEGIPHYMMPLDRTPDDRDVIEPRDRSQSPTNKQSYRKYSGEVPHYMLPLDRSPDDDDKTRQRSQSPSSRKPHQIYSGDVPHYMLPLDRAPEDRDDRPRNRSRSPTASQRSRSPTGRLPPQKYTTGNVPHYMLPLDRTPDEFESDRRSQSPSSMKPHHKYTGDVPHYMLPLDRTPDEHNEKPRQRSRSPATRQPYERYTGDVPHYMLPLDRTPDDYEPRRRSQSPTERQTRRYSGDVPHYMLPLDRTPEDHENLKSPRQRSRSPTSGKSYPKYEGGVPHYMLPIDHHRTDNYDENTKPKHRSRSPTTKLPYKSSEIPHYMLPLEKKPDDHDSVTPRQRSKSPTSGRPYPKYEGGVPHYMLPIDHHRTDNYDENTKPKHRSRSPTTKLPYKSSEIPHYMLPLEKKPDDHDSVTPRQRSKSPTSGRPYPKYEGGVPHYMLPLEHQHTDNYVDDSNKPKHRPRSPTTKLLYKSSETPHYMLPLEKKPDDHDRQRSKSPTSGKPYPKYERGVPHYMLPLDKKPDDHDSRQRSKSPTRVEKSTNGHHVPHYMLPISKAPHENHPENSRSRESTPKLSRGSTPDKQVPGYMKPLKSKKPSKKNILETETEVTQQNVENFKTITKFGVTLRRTSSGRKVITTSDNKEISDANDIENIFDINILDLLLEQATSYDQRRRIRSQMRVAKQTFGTAKAPHKIPKSSQKVITTSADTSSGVKKTSQVSREVTTKKSTVAVDRKNENVEVVRKTDTKPRQKSPEKSYGNKNVCTDVRKIVKTRNDVVVVDDDKPSWVTQKPLKKASERVVKKSSSVTTKSESVKVSSSSFRESEPLDLITSSYGVGPTDENGRPLFGLKALRAQNQTDTTKVKGTVIRSHFHSENGQEPVGEVSITKFSNEPSDFGEDINEEGLVSVTTTQKFGSKGTPSYKVLVDGQYDPDSCKNDSDTVSKTVTTKESRRGSVKELSKKYGESTVETVKTEKSGGYPKAGLILRSTLKDSKYEDDDGLDSQENYESVETIKSSSSSNTFLTNKSRVTGVQDVITRMKNSDIEYETGESVEDKEAKSLLNKFIGSQVILSGMETVCSSSTPVRTVKRTTTTTTTTTKEGEKPTTVTRTFVHPISEEELTTVWDEDTLKLLLERSTEYEERRFIRSRLRDVMAEQKVCEDVVAKNTEEVSEKVEETSQGTLIQGSVTTTQGATAQKTSAKPVSPFAKFRQLDKQNSLNTPPGTPRTPTGSAPLFKFTDPELKQQASTVKERLLQWCQMKTKEYENVQLDNFSSSWADGLAFCALIHHFRPDAFDYHKLTPKERRHNFTLAFRIADEQADIMPLLDVDDMVATRKPDWKCVFTYVQTIYARFKKED